MNKKDVLNLYKEGYSLNYIIKQYYRYKTKDEIPNHSFNGNYIITKKEYTLEKARREVESIILNIKNA